MTRGTLTILIMLAIAVIAAVASLVYHYGNQDRAQQFWGPVTALLIDRGPNVELYKVGPFAGLIDPDEETPPRSDSSEDSDNAPSAAGPQATRLAVEFNDVSWVVESAKDGTAAKGIANLRRALVQDTTFDWASPLPESEPAWKFGLAANDGRNWVTVLFDFDSRQVGLAGGRRTVLLDPQANADFQQFFAEQFGGEGSAAPAAEDATPQEDAAPAAQDAVAPAL